MSILRLTLFGAPQIVLGETGLTHVITGKAQALLIYLVVTGSVHTRDMLANLFWSELSLQQARNNLRYLLSDLRQVVGDYLVITPQTISFNRNRPYWLDVEVVRTTLASAAQANQAAIQEALVLQQGEFLAGFRVRNTPRFMAWVMEQRQMFHALTTEALTLIPPVNHNLPNLLTPFFGREQEIAEIVTLLGQDYYRLCTIIGEGGVGKTRLALAVAQAILDFRFSILDSDSGAPGTKAFMGAENLKSKIQNLKFPDGIWFVPLADIPPTDDLPAQLATAIGKALHFTFSGQGVAAQIIHYLANKRLLLILDNFEHLQVGSEFLLELLYKTTATRLLITSRHRLNMQAEYPWRITGLPLPPVEQAATLTVAEILRYPGMALFVERARHAHPGFQLDATNQAQVLQICRFVQGLPLGIELAAALTKEYACAELLAVLQQDYAVLQSTLPDLTARHRNIKLVFDYSWRFLRTEEARILAECTLFRGGFDQTVAAAVTGATPAVLATLVDQSLLHWTTEIGGRRRYDLHALVRQYAQDQWSQLPLRQQAKARYAAYYLAQLQQAEAALLQDRVAQEQVRCDLANIQAAWFWCVEQGEWALLLQGVEALARFYHLTGLHHEGLQTLQAALPVARRAMTMTQQAQALLASLLIRSSEFYRYLNQLAEAETLAQEALILGQQTADIALQSWAYHELARVAQRRNQHAAMGALAQQAANLARQTGIARLQAISLNALGVTEVLGGNAVQAVDYYQLALHHLQQAPDSELEALVLANLGGAYKRCREYSAAVNYLSQSVMRTDAIHDRYGAAVNRILLGNLWLDLGACDRAQTLYTQAFAIFEDLHDPYWEAWGRTSQALLWLLCNEPAAAIRECERVLPWVQNKMPLFEHRILTHLGDAYCMLGEWTKGEALHRQAFALQQTAELHFRLAEPVIRLAERLLARGQNAAALALLEEPLDELATQGFASSAEPFILYHIGYLVLKANADPRADALLFQAYTLLQELAAKIDGLVLRRAFLENLPHRRRLLALAQERFAHVAPPTAK